MITRSSYEQLGRCLNLGNREDSTVRAKIAELLRLNASVSEDEQLNLKENVDRMKGELDIYSIGEEVPQVPYIDKTVDVPGVRQGQVHYHSTYTENCGSATGFNSFIECWDDAKTCVARANPGAHR